MKFPLDGLCLSEWIEGDTGDDALYKLYAVVVHSGRGIGQGHYMAYVRHDVTGTCIEDST